MVMPRGYTTADAKAAAAEFLAAPGARAARQWIERACSPTGPAAASMRRYASDVLRLIGERRPITFSRYADLLIEEAFSCPLEEWQSRQYFAMAAAYAADTRPQRLRLAVLLRALVRDERTAVRCSALEAFAALGLAEPALRDEAASALEAVHRTGTAAERARARRLLPQLAAAR